MVYKIYSIFDTKSKIFSEPFLAQNESVAVRRFNYLMSNSQMIADDCELWCLGLFNNENGLISDNDEFEFGKTNCNVVRGDFVCKYNGGDN